MAQLCVLGIVFFVMLVSLALTVVALLTDNWYRVYTDDNINPAIRNSYNYHYGLWRLCYDDMPYGVAADDSHRKEGSCIYIYEDLIQRDEGTLDEHSQLRLHMSRTVLGCSMAGAAATLFALLSAVCGVWPSRTLSAGRRSCIYVSAAILLLISTMCGITSGVSFIAIRDMDNTQLRRTEMVPPAVPEYAHQAYDWSFMLHWSATGMAFLASFLMMCLLRNQSITVSEDAIKLNGFNSPS